MKMNPWLLLDFLKRIEEEAHQPEESPAQKKDRELIQGLSDIVGESMVDSEIWIDPPPVDPVIRFDPPLTPVQPYQEYQPIIFEPTIIDVGDTITISTSNGTDATSVTTVSGVADDAVFTGGVGITYGIS